MIQKLIHSLLSRVQAHHPTCPPVSGIKPLRLLISYFLSVVGRFFTLYKNSYLHLWLFCYTSLHLSLGTPNAHMSPSYWERFEIAFWPSRFYSLRSFFFIFWFWTLLLSLLHNFVPLESHFLLFSPALDLYIFLPTLPLLGTPPVFHILVCVLPLLAYIECSSFALFMDYYSAYPWAKPDIIHKYLFLPP